MSRLLIALLWLLHWLPLAVLSRLGEGFGLGIWYFARSRRAIALSNLHLCFPDMDEASRARLVRGHFRALGRSLLERGLLWWSTEKRLRGLIRVQGEEKLAALYRQERPVILLAPHFIGLDAGGAAIAMRFNCMSMYARQKDKVVDYWLHYGRSRFGEQKLLSRQDGIRTAIKALKSGCPFYYLPDMDYGRADAVFVPFFSVPAATITGLARLAKLSGASVLPCPTRMLPGGAGYVVEIGDPWPDYPTDDVLADTTRMNQWIEQTVLTMPEQYYWVHRRFKTRPDGEARIY